MRNTAKRNSPTLSLPFNIQFPTRKYEITVANLTANAHTALCRAGVWDVCISDHAISKQVRNPWYHFAGPQSNVIPLFLPHDHSVFKLKYILLLKTLLLRLLLLHRDRGRTGFIGFRIIGFRVRFCKRPYYSLHLKTSNFWGVRCKANRFLK